MTLSQLPCHSEHRSESDGAKAQTLYKHMRWPHHALQGRNSRNTSPLDLLTTAHVTVAAEFGAQTGSSFQQLQPAKSTWAPALQRKKENVLKRNLLKLSPHESSEVLHGRREPQCGAYPATVADADRGISTAPSSVSVVDEEHMQNEQEIKMAALEHRAQMRANRQAQTKNVYSCVGSNRPPLVSLS